MLLKRAKHPLCKAILSRLDLPRVTTQAYDKIYALAASCRRGAPFLHLPVARACEPETKPVSLSNLVELCTKFDALKDRGA